MISFEDFAKLDIRIATVVSVEKVPDADKLLKFMFDVGQEENRQIIAGLAEHFPDPQELVGKQMPVLLNIEPRELRGLTSYGMIVAADDEDGKPLLLHPAKKVKPGAKIR